VINEWNIVSRGHACQSCSAAFADKQTYFTILFDERHEFQRIDVCEKCWNEQYREARERKGFISCWQGVYAAPPAMPVEAIQKETAETVLRKLVELNDPKYVAASFILAVMLERKRILRVKDQVKTEGRRVFVYEHPKTGDVFTIPDPDLQLNQLETVQRDVAQLLEHGLPSETPGAPQAASQEASPAETAPGPAPAAAPAAVAEEIAG
jgi:hypothetical protein